MYDFWKSGGQLGEWLHACTRSTAHSTSGMLIAHDIMRSTPGLFRSALCPPFCRALCSCLCCVVGFRLFCLFCLFCCTTRVQVGDSKTVFRRCPTALCHRQMVPYISSLGYSLFFSCHPLFLGFVDHLTIFIVHLLFCLNVPVLLLRRQMGCATLRDMGKTLRRGTRHGMCHDLVP